MRQTLLGLLLLLSSPWLALAQDTQPPPWPASVTVGAAVPQLNNVQYRLSITPVLDPPSNTPVPTYLWGAGFSDGQVNSGNFAATGENPILFDLLMPYHISGTAQSGFVCIKAKDAAGNESAQGACAPVLVPAKPVAQPSTATVRIDYTEPTTNDCSGSPGPYALGGDCTGTGATTPTCPVLNDLKLIRATYTIDSGPAQTMDFSASRPEGGGNMHAAIVVGQNVGLFTVAVQAVDTCNNISPPTLAVTKDLKTTIPYAGSATFSVIQQ